MAGNPTNRTMKSHTHVLTALVFGCCCLVACSATGVTRVGENSFMIARQSATGFQSAVGIRGKVLEEATQHCASSDKHMVIHNMQTRDGVPGQSYATVNLTFGCYSKDDPVYITANPDLRPDVVIESQQKVTTDVVAKAETSTKRDVYEELLKLDELRKKGIITEAEFEAEKQKILNGK